jgi:archaellum biogenesis ATPase FlaH
MTELLTKEQFILETLISNSDLYTKCHGIINQSYFAPELQNTVKFILEYSNKYNSVPIPDLIEAETQITLKPRNITKDIFEYSCDEIEKFCKYQGFKNALMASIPLMEENKLDSCFELIKESLLISLEKDLGLDYFLDPEGRLKNMIENQSYQSTGYNELDDLLGGGLVRGQMIVFSGNSGAGKSMTLSNVGLNLLEDGLNLLYISLELSQNLVSNRFDGLITGFKQTDWIINADKTVQKLKICSDEGKYGSLFIKYMESGSNANKVKSYLKEFEIKNGFLPDVIMLDYLDIAGSNAQVSPSDVSLKDKYVSEEFRNLANEYDSYFLTASQQNRGSIGIMEPDQSHIAGGLTKANTSDFWFSIIATDEMKSEGIIRYHCIKARSSDGVGKSITLKWNPSSARISNLTGNMTKNIMDSKNINRKSKETKTKPLGNGGLNSNLIQITT